MTIFHGKFAKQGHNHLVSQKINLTRANLIANNEMYEFEEISHLNFDSFSTSVTYFNKFLPS